MDAPLLEAKFRQHSNLQSIFGKMTVHYGAKTTARIMELIEEMLGSPTGLIVGLKELPLKCPPSVGQRIAEYNNTYAALNWLLNRSRSRARALSDAFGFQIISYPNLKEGGLQLARLM